MLHVNEKTLIHIVNYEKTIFWQKKNEKSDMASVNVEKTLEYFKIQWRLRSKNLTKHYLCKSLPWKVLYKHKVKQITELPRTLWLSS